MNKWSFDEEDSLTRCLCALRLHWAITFVASDRKQSFTMCADRRFARWCPAGRPQPPKPLSTNKSHGVVKDPAIVRTTFFIQHHTCICRDTFCQVGMIMSCEEPDIPLLLQPRQSLVVTGTQRLPSPCRRLIDWAVKKRGNVLDSGQRRTSVPRMLLPPTCNSTTQELCVLWNESRLFCVARNMDTVWKSCSILPGARTKTQSGVLHQQLSTSCSGGGWSSGKGWNSSNTVRQREERHFGN